METLISVLPNLSIGVVCIGALVYITIRFIMTLDSRADKHEKAMFERENAMRLLEQSVRQSLTEHLTQASIALAENTRALSRVIRHLDGSSKD